MSLPLPRLRCIKTGERFTLRGETRPRVLIETDRHYGYFTDGRASLCDPLNPATLAWAAGGWRTEIRSDFVSAYKIT